MVVLVNGCSFSRGPDSWPYVLQNKYKFDLINLAQCGAGNTYIFESTIFEILNRNYDLVLIMWSAPSRIDYRVETVFNSSYTSLQSSKLNDWPAKVIHPINDQDYVQKDWIFGCGFLNNDKEMKKVFESYYRLVSYKQLIESFLIKVLALQNFLKQKKINYVFSFYQDYIEDLKNANKKLFNDIDLANCCIEDNIYNITQRQNWFDTDNIHPNTNAHYAWAQELDKHIKHRKIF
jgi:hypothetical protein